MSAARAYRVGLTGGLASGKSTVGGWLREAGFEVIDADQLVAELHRPGGPGAAAARDLFGAAVLTPAGGVDHAALAARLFSDAAARTAFERAIHPLVRQRFEEIAAGPAQDDSPGSPRRVVVLEATLLVEAGYGPGFDLIVTVEASPEAQLARAVGRGLAEPAARARLAAQGDGARRRQAAHRVIENDGDLAELRRQVDSLIVDLRLAAAGAGAAAQCQPPDAAAGRPAAGTHFAVAAGPAAAGSATAATLVAPAAPASPATAASPAAPAGPNTAGSAAAATATAERHPPAAVPAGSARPARP